MRATLLGIGARRNRACDRRYSHCANRPRKGSARTKRHAGPGADRRRIPCAGRRLHRMPHAAPRRAVCRRPRDAHAVRDALHAQHHARPRHGHRPLERGRLLPRRRKGKDGSLLYPAFPYPSYTKMTRADSDAIYAYLRGITPVRRKNTPHRMKFPYGERNLLIGWRARERRVVPVSGVALVAHPRGAGDSARENSVRPLPGRQRPVRSPGCEPGRLSVACWPRPRTRDPVNRAHLRPEHPGSARRCDSRRPSSRRSRRRRLTVRRRPAVRKASSRSRRARRSPAAQIGEMHPGEQVVRVGQSALAVHPEPDVKADLPVREEHVDPAVEQLRRGVGKGGPACGATRRSSTPPPSWTADPGVWTDARPVRRPPPPTPLDSTPPAMEGEGRS